MARGETAKRGAARRGAFQKKAHVSGIVRRGSFEKKAHVSHPPRRECHKLGVVNVCYGFGGCPCSARAVW